MCGLCGILGDGNHWSDGIGRDAASAVPWLRRQARRERVLLGNAVLRGSGLRLEDWQGSGFVLRQRTGGAEMVTSLADLWPKVARAAGQPIDPLDPALLEALDQITGG